jgi:tRNA-2-methylthio-N6-dimethylallyladenosine synthase
VLVAGPSKATAKEGRAFVEGRTERNEIVHVEEPEGRSLVGEVVEVEVVRANKHSVFGTPTAAGLAALTPVGSRPAVMDRRRRSLPVFVGS